MTPDRAARRRAIGRAIRDQRRATGHSQKWLAEQLGIPTSKVSDWERGRTEANIVWLNAIADALDCDIAALAPSEES